LAHPPDDDIDQQRDEVIKRMIATPPKAHKDEPKRRATPSPEVRQLPKRRTNRNRKEV